MATLIRDELLKPAIIQRASDIHLEPQVANWRIRFRIDGILHVFKTVGEDYGIKLMTALKIAARVDIAEKRLPQDGSFMLKIEQISYDIRLSSCPTIHGEKLVLRISPTTLKHLDLNNLGFEKEQLKLLTTILQRPSGMLLVTGPTGSGKTVTLYSILNHLNCTTRNIVTIEDPVEIKLPGINQVAIQPKIDLNFAKVLRAFLRQDPDIIMVGEIRDEKTAQIAIQAAQTGHLVLATLHTNSAIETVTRLLNMGISALDIASTIKLIIAQRLVRKISATGFSGRIGIFEVLNFTSQIATQIINDRHAFNILPLALNNNFKTLTESAAIKVANGITTSEEVLRNI